MKRIALAAVLLFVLVGPAWAGFDEGSAAYERGDYETALKEYRPLAEQGDLTQYELVSGQDGKSSAENLVASD